MCFGGSTNTIQQSKFEPPDNTKAGWDAYVQQVLQNGSQPYQEYQGMRVAPLNDLQNSGLQQMTDLSMNGSPTLNSARAQSLATSNGQFLNNNPFAQNKYVDNVIANNAANMSTAFANGTAAQNDALANSQGAYGGSGWQQKQSADAMGLARSVGQMADQTRMNQTNLAAGMYGDERNRMMATGQQALGYNAADVDAAKNLTGVGDSYNAYMQKLLDSAYGDFQSKLNWNKTQTDSIGSGLKNASSGIGNTTTSGPGASPLGILGGLGLAAASFF